MVLQGRHLHGWGVPKVPLPHDRAFDWFTVALERKGCWASLQVRDSYTTRAVVPIRRLPGPGEVEEAGLIGPARVEDCVLHRVSVVEHSVWRSVCERNGYRVHAVHHPVVDRCDQMPRMRWVSVGVEAQHHIVFVLAQVSSVGLDRNQSHAPEPRSRRRQSGG